MYNTFLISFRLKTTYRVNSIIYMLKQIPVIKKFLPSTLYKSQGLKVFVTIISIMWEIVSIFLGKIIYFFVMLMIPLYFFDNININSFFQLLLFLSLSGAFFNTGMFEPSKDKYYAVILMKMDGRQFVLSQYLYMLTRYYLGCVPCLMFLSSLLKYPIGLACIIPLFTIGLKLIVAVIYLNNFKKEYKKRKIMNNSPVIVGFCILCLILGYVTIYYNQILSINILSGIYISTIIVGIVALIYVLRYPFYQMLCRTLLKDANILVNTNSKDIILDSYRKMISLDTKITSNKSGFEYFNELFMQRHKKILWKSAKRQTLVIGIIILVLISVIIMDMEIKKNVGEALTNMLPYLVFIMYLLNTTKNVTQAMFINCDHCMLTYSFYRIDKNILYLFKIRLREIIKINLLPTLVLAFGYVLALIISQGINYTFYALISFISIISMSIFFSTHYLILYYLLQPYNAQTEVKNPVYSIITSFTYIICYAFTRLSLPIVTFGVVCIFFCFSYCIIACILVYRKANKTFKIRN